MYDLTACGVFYTAGPADVRCWQSRCYDHESVWVGLKRPSTDAGFNRASADADRHYRTEHPNA